MIDFITYFLTTVGKIESNDKNIDALVIGNGPSLVGLLQSEINFSDFDLFVCNGFALTSNYEMLKPKNYALLDPAYFNLELDAVKNNEIDVLKIWEALITKTSWNLDLYTSQEFKKFEKQIKNRFGCNDRINFVYLKKTNYVSSLKFYFLSKTKSIVGNQTVVQLLVAVTLYKNYKNIYMAGVDHDWIENIKYDEINHKVYLNDKHFYNSNKIIYGEGIYKNLDLAQELTNLAKSFNEFKALYDFSRYLKIDLFVVTRTFLYFIPFKKIQ
jgi:hypothetical protein